MRRHWRLRGEVDGVERTYPLAAALSRVGSLGDNEVVLPARGVSRHHAQISADASGVFVEDLGSRNGTTVNGASVQRARLAAGDVIRFGPVRLRLEEVDEDDARLAFEVDVPAPGAAASTTTGASSSRRAPTEWWEPLEDVVAMLGGGAAADLAGALGRLVRGLRARGACVVEWAGGGEAMVVATTGEIESPMSHEGFRAFVSRSLRHPGLTTAVLTGTPPIACAVVASERGDALALVLWGDFPRREECEPMLRVVARLLAGWRSLAAPAAPANSESGRLVLPEGCLRGDSPAMSAVYAQMMPLLQADLPVLLLGETGVGKEYLARTLHLSSPRRHGPFVAINCAAIPAELLEAELFGIGRGVATGVTERPGSFRLAQRGTLFLDEIGDMPPALQAKLLRALQEKEVQPVGGRPVPVDIRVVAATNTDLHQRMEQGRFRRDLYYRVAGFALRVPPLRERREDIPALVEQFLRAAAVEAGKAIRGITVKALRRLVEHSWPGNVRELEHEVRALVYRCPDGQAIDSGLLSEFLAAPRPAPEDAGQSAAPTRYHDAVNEARRRVVLAALNESRGRFTEAARALGVHPNYLHRLVKSLDLRHAVRK